MENAKDMREIALAVMREKITRELDNATELVEGPIFNIIMKTANEGLTAVVIHIPAGYNIAFVIQVLEDYGYETSVTQKIGNYLIKW